MVQSLNKTSVFSALISKNEPSNNSNDSEDPGEINIHLEIPDLPKDINLFKWQIPSSASYEWIDYKKILSKPYKVPNKPSLNTLSEDEGFHSSFDVSKSDCLSEDREENIWDMANKYKISDYVDWQMREEYDTSLKVLIFLNKSA